MQSTPTAKAGQQLDFEVNRRRTFAIISHPDAGKTTLTEKLLLYAGAVNQAGSVRAGKNQRSATSDWMAMELILIQRRLDHPFISPMLGRMEAFMDARVDAQIFVTHERSNVSSAGRPIVSLDAQFASFRGQRRRGGRGAGGSACSGSSGHECRG